MIFSAPVLVELSAPGASLRGEHHVPVPGQTHTHDVTMTFFGVTACASTRSAFCVFYLCVCFKSMCG
jgi:hypothetical protein